VWNNPSVTIDAMQVGDIAGSYVKYIGAGIMLSGGLISAIRLIPVVASSIRETMSAKDTGKGGGGALQTFVLLGGIAVGFVGGFLISGGNMFMAIVTTILSLILSMLFVIVAGRLTGTIGTSNLPVSGMTIASIVVVTLLFAGMGWTSGSDNRSLLLFGTFIVTAIATAGGYSQSQKVTFIIGGEKNEMHNYYAIATIAGVAVVTGVILLLSEQLSMTGDNVPFALPQANLMATLTSGIMSGQLPWVMIIAGAILGIVFFMLNLPVMTVAIGFYLPISTTSIILVGALLRVFVEKYSKSETEKDARVSNGVSLSSGLVAGGSIIGLIGIILQVTGVIGAAAPSGFAGTNGMAFILLVILVVATLIPLMNGKIRHVD
jgi:putative OPT family oligopeptide transporter